MDIVRGKFIHEDELMALGEDARVEIIDGELVPMSPVGMLHHIITGNIYRKIDHFVFTNRLGIVFMDGLICILDKKAKHLKGAQVPDVCFIRKGRIPKGYDLSRPFPGAPDLAVEVMSPDDSVEGTLTRVRKYLKAGSEQVWVVFPAEKEIHQYRRDNPDVVRVYKGDTLIDVDGLLIGLEITADDCFAMPEME